MRPLRPLSFPRNSSCSWSERTLRFARSNSAGVTVGDLTLRTLRQEPDVLTCGMCGNRSEKQGEPFCTVRGFLVRSERSCKALTAAFQ